jgi:hypothetical protein
MSNQGFKGIPGVPDGWELIHANRCGEIGDYGIDGDGSPFKFEQRSIYKFAIIRKIEEPKKYRPFANGAEFKPHRDRWVRIFSGDNDCGCYLDQRDIGGKRKIDGCSEHSICIWEGWMTYGDAFECFVFDDGSPFGVEVTSE